MVGQQGKFLASGSKETTVSIIVPTFNRAKTLSLTLKSIFLQEGIDQYEVIVVDNGSTDETADVCRQFKNNGFQLNYIFEAEPGLLSGRHAGALTAKGNILCFLDDDIELNQSWLDGVFASFKNPQVMLATGPSLPKYEIEPPEWINYFWEKSADGGKFCSWLSLMDFGDALRDIKPVYIFGLNFCIRKEALFSLGGFHPDNIPKALQKFQGDGETGLAYKALEKNLKCVYHPAIKVQHLISSDRLTKSYFEKRAYYQGVCDSYTTLRKNGVVAKKAISFKMVKQRVKDVITFLKNRNFPKDVRALKKALNNAYMAGFQFHQHAYINSEAIREWVLKENYWDYKLPK